MQTYKNKFFKDVIHGEINIDSTWVWQLINTKEFKRLNKIKQLGFSYLLFPSATHTRFAHSLGVYEITNRVLRELKLKDQIPSNIKQTQINELLAAALLHDIGHGPHSHSFELYTCIEHEKYTKQIILDEKTSVNKILKKYKIKPENVVKILDHNHPIKWFNQLVSAQIDVDRMDYLVRDSHHSGACYGNIDLGIIIKRIMIINDEIVFDEKAISPIENLLFARYYMFTQVYEKPKIVLYETMIKKLLLRSKALYKLNKLKNNLVYLYQPWFDDVAWQSEQYLGINDENFSLFLELLREENDKQLNEIFKIIDNFWSTNFITVDHSIKKFSELKTRLESKANYLDLHLSTIMVRTKTIYKTQVEKIMIFDSNENGVVDILEKSIILKKLANALEPKKMICYCL